MGDADAPQKATAACPPRHLCLLQNIKMNVAGSLVRRGLDAHAEHGDKIKIPTWGAVMLISTFIAFLFAMFMIEYTFGRLVPTLVMIESPQDTISFEPLPTEDPDSTINKDPEQPSKPQLITSSIRRTVRHLGGFSSRFRGLSIFIVNTLAVQWIAGILSVLPIINLLPRGFANIVALILCAQLSLTWTHIVISQPSPKTWFRRLAPLKMWKKVAIPTAIFARRTSGRLHSDLHEHSCRSRRQGCSANRGHEAQREDRHVFQGNRDPPVRRGLDLLGCHPSQRHFDPSPSLSSR